MNRNKTRIVVATALLTIDIVLYVLFHDISKLFIFHKIKDWKIIVLCESMHEAFRSFIIYIPFWKIVNNYLIDALWFISFYLYISTIINSKWKYFLSFFIGLFSEFLQLIKPAAGTFDFLDIILYLFLVLIVFFCEIRGVAGCPR